MYSQTNNFDKKVSSLGYIHTLASTAAVKKNSHFLPSSLPRHLHLEAEHSGELLSESPLPFKQGSVMPSSAKDIGVEVGWELLFSGDQNLGLVYVRQLSKPTGTENSPLADC